MTHAGKKQRERFLTIADVPLTVRFVGNMEDDNLGTVIPALVAHDLASKPIGYRFVHDTSVAHPSRASFTVHVTKGLRPEWFSINDRAGFVERNPPNRSEAAWRDLFLSSSSHDEVPLLRLLALDFREDG